MASFFEPATKDQPFHSAEDRVIVRRYRALVDFLTTELAEARVIRVGELEIEIFVLGKTCDDEWLGVQTKVIET